MIATNEEFHAERQTRLGASDFPALLGISPRKTRHELWLEKTGRIEPDKSGQAADIGNDLETGVLDGATRVYGEIERDVRVWREDVDFPLAATLDARIIASGEPINAKTSGMTGPVYGHWGDAGTDQAPDYYLAQSLIEQYVANSQRGHLFALLAGRGYVPYVVPYSAPAVNAMVDSARRFWIDHVEADKEPPLEEPPSLEVMKRLKREPKKSAVWHDGDAALVDRVFRLRRALRLVEKRKKEAEALLLKLLGDCELAELPDGRTVTNYESQRKNKPRLEETVSRYRTLRINQPKG